MKNKTIQVDMNEGDVIVVKVTLKGGRIAYKELQLDQIFLALAEDHLNMKTTVTFSQRNINHDN